MQGLVAQEFSVTLGGRERVLRLGMNAICAAENITGLKLLFGLGVEPWASAMVLRALIWAGIQWEEEHLPPGDERRTSLDQVGNWIDEVGAGDVVAAVMGAWLDAMPEEEEPDVEPSKEGDEAGTPAVPFEEEHQDGTTS